MARRPAPRYISESSVMRRIAILLTAIAGLACAGRSCSAQSTSLFSSGGSTTQRSTTGGTATQGLGQTGGLGQGGGGQAGGLGQGGLGGSGTSTSGPQLNQFGSVGSQVGQNAFVGQQNTGQFIGVRSTTTQQGQNTMPRFTQAGGNSGGGFQPEQPQTNERRVRPRYRVAFDYSALTTSTVAERSRQQIQKFETAFNLPSSISAEIDDAGTVTLRGQADSSEMSRLIANVVRLEPGVHDVKNELVVADKGSP